MKYTLKDYLTEKEKTFWNPFNLPRWVYILVPPLFITANYELVDILIFELLILVLLFVHFLLLKRKKKQKNN